MHLDVGEDDVDRAADVIERVLIACPSLRRWTAPPDETSRRRPRAGRRRALLLVNSKGTRGHSALDRGLQVLADAGVDAEPHRPTVAGAHSRSDPRAGA